ncbi:MAG TPA: endonuclease III [Anaerolineae bacterium]|nr:endonuclease III [Anaerolineae bacterium]
MVDRAQRSEKEQRAKARSVYRQLAEVYGQPTWRQHNDPVSELVLTFLSQNTSDVNSHRAFKYLKERYPTWDTVLAAPTEELADTIRSGGLADIKAPRIQTALQHILDERGEFSLEFLGSLPLKQAEQYLTSLNGIGHKSAAIVLLFCFGMPVFPVDTHVHRVSHRLGIVSPKNSREHTQRTWETLVPAEAFYSLHLNLIRHGRQVCGAAKPRCAVCVLQPHCDKYQADRSEASNSARR